MSRSFKLNVEPVISSKSIKKLQDTVEKGLSGVSVKLSSSKVDVTPILKKIQDALDKSDGVQLFSDKSSIKTDKLKGYLTELVKTINETLAQDSKLGIDLKLNLAKSAATIQSEINKLPQSSINIDIGVSANSLKTIQDSVKSINDSISSELSSADIDNFLNKLKTALETFQQSSKNVSQETHNSIQNIINDLNNLGTMSKNVGKVTSSINRLMANITGLNSEKIPSKVSDFIVRLGKAVDDFNKKGRNFDSIATLAHNLTDLSKAIPAVEAASGKMIKGDFNKLLADLTNFNPKSITDVADAFDKMMSKLSGSPDFVNLIDSLKGIGEINVALDGDLTTVFTNLKNSIDDATKAIKEKNENKKEDKKAEEEGNKEEDKKDEKKEDKKKDKKEKIEEEEEDDYEPRPRRSSYSSYVGNSFGPDNSNKWSTKYSSLARLEEFQRNMNMAGLRLPPVLGKLIGYGSNLPRMMDILQSSGDQHLEEKGVFKASEESIKNVINTDWGLKNKDGKDIKGPKADDIFTGSDGQKRTAQEAIDKSLEMGNKEYFKLLQDGMKEDEAKTKALELAAKALEDMSKRGWSDKEGNKKSEEEIDSLKNSLKKGGPDKFKETAGNAIQAPNNLAIRMTNSASNVLNKVGLGKMATFTKGLGTILTGVFTKLNIGLFAVSTVLKVGSMLWERHLDKLQKSLTQSNRVSQIESNRAITRYSHQSADELQKIKSISEIEQKRLSQQAELRKSRMEMNSADLASQKEIYKIELKRLEAAKQGELIKSRGSQIGDIVKDQLEANKNKNAARTNAKMSEYQWGGWRNVGWDSEGNAKNKSFMKAVSEGTGKKVENMRFESGLNTEKELIRINEARFSGVINNKISEIQGFLDNIASMEGGPLSKETQAKLDQAAANAMNNAQSFAAFEDLSGYINLINSKNGEEALKNQSVKWDEFMGAYAARNGKGDIEYFNDVQKGDMAGLTAAIKKLKSEQSALTSSEIKRYEETKKQLDESKKQLEAVAKEAELEKAISDTRLKRQQRLIELEKELRSEMFTKLKENWSSFSSWQTDSMSQFAALGNSIEQQAMDNSNNPYISRTIAQAAQEFQTLENSRVMDLRHTAQLKDPRIANNPDAKMAMELQQGQEKAWNDEKFKLEKRLYEALFDQQIAHENELFSLSLQNRRKLFDLNMESLRKESEVRISNRQIDREFKYKLMDTMLEARKISYTKMGRNTIEIEKEQKDLAIDMYYEQIISELKKKNNEENATLENTMKKNDQAVIGKMEEENLKAKQDYEDERLAKRNDLERKMLEEEFKLRIKQIEFEVKYRHQLEQNYKDQEKIIQDTWGQKPITADEAKRFFGKDRIEDVTQEELNTLGEKRRDFNDDGYAKLEEMIGDRRAVNSFTQDAEHPNGMTLQEYKQAKLNKLMNTDDAELTEQERNDKAYLSKFAVQTNGKWEFDEGVGKADVTDMEMRKKWEHTTALDFVGYDKDANGKVTNVGKNLIGESVDNLKEQKKQVEDETYGKVNAWKEEVGDDGGWTNQEMFDDSVHDIKRRMGTDVNYSGKLNDDQMSLVDDMLNLVNKEGGFDGPLENIYDLLTGEKGAALVKSKLAGRNDTVDIGNLIVDGIVSGMDSNKIKETLRLRESWNEDEIGVDEFHAKEDQLIAQTTEGFNKGESMDRTMNEKGEIESFADKNIDKYREIDDLQKRIDATSANSEEFNSLVTGLASMGDTETTAILAQTELEKRNAAKTQDILLKMCEYMDKGEHAENVKEYRKELAVFDRKTKKAIDTMVQAGEMAVEQKRTEQEINRNETIDIQKVSQEDKLKQLTSQQQLAKQNNQINADYAKYYDKIQSDRIKTIGQAQMNMDNNSQEFMLGFLNASDGNGMLNAQRKYALSQTFTAREADLELRHQAQKDELERRGATDVERAALEQSQAREKNALTNEQKLAEAISDKVGQAGGLRGLVEAGVGEKSGLKESWERMQSAAFGHIEDPTTDAVTTFNRDCQAQFAQLMQFLGTQLPAMVQAFSNGNGKGLPQELISKLMGGMGGNTYNTYNNAGAARFG